MSTPVQVVEWLGAVQGQEYDEAKYSVGQRVQAGTDATVQAALDSGSILRIHLLRPTWHFVTAADIRWILSLTAPRVHQLNRTYYRKFGLDDDVLARSDGIIGAALTGGRSLIRTELSDALHRAGIAGDGLRMGYLLMHAELEGIICSGPRRGRQHSYALLDDRVPPTPERSREQALSDLCLRFFRSHGPATAHDFANWSGLTVTDARQGVATLTGQLDSWTDPDGATWWCDTEPAPDDLSTGAVLLPMYDEATVGYKGVRIVLARQPSEPDLLQRSIVIDGYTVGSWKRVVSKKSAVIEATLFTDLRRAQTHALEEAVAGFGRFLERPASLTTHAAR